MSAPKYVMFKGAKYKLAAQLPDDAYDGAAADLALAFETMAKLADGFGMRGAAQELADAAQDHNLLFNLVADVKGAHVEAGLAEVLRRTFVGLDNTLKRIHAEKPRSESETGHMW